MPAIIMVMPFKPADPVIRFMSHVQKGESPDGCWIWKAYVPPKGYGQFWLNGDNKTGAHRFSYTTFNGSIPDGLQIDHLCRNKVCVNPKHLEAVTARENQMRNPDSIVLANLLKTHCHRGHELIGDNLYKRKDNRRDCMTCRRLNNKKHSKVKSSQ